MRIKIHRNRKWAQDCDYRHKLSEDELAFYDQFEAEYYRGEFGAKPLHCPDRRQDIYDANNASFRDIFTAHPRLVVKYRQAVPTHRPSIKSRFYFASDYETSSANPEDFLLDLLDENLKVCNGCMRFLQNESCHDCGIVYLSHRKTA